MHLEEKGKQNWRWESKTDNKWYKQNQNPVKDVKIVAYSNHFICKQIKLNLNSVMEN